jgi:TolA-binding protein
MKFFSKFALALSLSSVAIAPAAYAKTDKKEAQTPAQIKVKLSKKFITAYSPAVTAANKQKDIPAAVALLPSVRAGIENEDDRYEAGNFFLSVGVASKDKKIQSEGLDLLLASTTTPVDQRGKFLFYKGAFAFDDKDYATAENNLKQAYASGYRANDTSFLIATTQYQLGKYTEAQNSMRNAVAEKNAAGQQVPSDWYVRAKSIATKQKDNAGTIYWATELVKATGSKEAYHDLLFPFLAYTDLTMQERLDTYRLARETGSMLFEQEYKGYIEYGDRQRNPAEALAILNEGSAKGLINLSSITFAEAIRDATADKIELARNWDADEQFAMKQSSGTQAMLFADRLFGFGEFARAAANYKTAIDKGNLVGRDGVDYKDQALTRLGITKLKTGDFAGAKLEWAKVSSANRKSIVSFWTIYANQRLAALAPPAAPAVKPAS